MMVVPSLMCSLSRAKKSPFSPSLEIFAKSMKCVPMTSEFTRSLSRSWIFILRQSGGNISVKMICSFQTGSYVPFLTDVFA